MEFDSTSFDINLSNAELDEILNLDFGHNQMVTSTPNLQTTDQFNENTKHETWESFNHFHREPIDLSKSNNTKQSNSNIESNMFVPLTCNSSRNFPFSDLSESINFFETQETDQSFHITDLELPPSALFYSDNDNIYDFKYKNAPIPQLCNISVSQKSNLTQIPLSIMKLYESVRTSFTDFSFVYALSAQMCQEFIPMDCFVTLKMALLLSIASLENKQTNQPIHIITFGTESSLINRIMKHIGNVAQRFVAQVDSLQSSGGMMTNETMLEAGPLLLAKHGICYLGDWSAMKLNDSNKILKEIECEAVFIEKSNLSFPLQCSVWCYWTGSFKDCIKDKRTLNSFLKIFGIPVILDESNSTIKLMDFILDQATSQHSFTSEEDDLTISLDDMKEFLKIVANRHVIFSQEALEILQKYFMVSRVKKPDGLTQQACKTIKGFSASFAKLSLRHEVIECDAVAAIFLAENSMNFMFGHDINPSPSFLSVNKNCIVEIDEFFKTFQIWFKNYINTI